MLKHPRCRVACINDAENLLTSPSGGRLPLVAASAIIRTISDITGGMPVRAAMAKSFLQDYLTPLANTAGGSRRSSRDPMPPMLCCLSAGGSSSPPGTPTWSSSW